MAFFLNTNTMKQLLFFFIFIPAFATAIGQTKSQDAVKAVLKSYKDKLEKLDTTGVSVLFIPGAKVYEGGSDEGSIQNYLSHHLAPEFKQFKSFTFGDYKVDVKVNGDYAYATETYTYTIVLTNDDTRIKSKGVATSVLRKTKDGWKIEMSHSSFRRLKT